MLTVQDYQNILRLLTRSSYVNLDEAKAAFVIESRINATVKQMLAPPAAPVEALPEPAVANKD